MHSAGLRSASRSRSAWGRAESATAAAMCFDTVRRSAAVAGAIAEMLMTAIKAAKVWLRKPLLMTISLVFVRDDTCSRHVRRQNANRVRMDRHGDDFARHAVALRIAGGEMNGRDGEIR